MRTYKDLNIPSTHIHPNELREQGWNTAWINKLTTGTTIPSTVGTNNLPNIIYNRAETKNLATNDPEIRDGLKHQEATQAPRDLITEPLNTDNTFTRSTLLRLRNWTAGHITRLLGEEADLIVIGAMKPASRYSRERVFWAEANDKALAAHIAKKGGVLEEAKKKNRRTRTAMSKDSAIWRKYNNEWHAYGLAELLTEGAVVSVSARRGTVQRKRVVSVIPDETAEGLVFAAVEPYVPSVEDQVLGRLKGMGVQAAPVKSVRAEVVLGEKPVVGSELTVNGRSGVVKSAREFLIGHDSAEVFGEHLAGHGGEVGWRVVLA